MTTIDELSKQVFAVTAAAYECGANGCTNDDFDRLVADPRRALVADILALAVVPAAPQVAAAPADEREAFEAWATSERYDVTLSRFGAPIGMEIDYDKPRTDLMWKVWQARAALAAAPEVAAPAAADIEALGWLAEGGWNVSRLYPSSIATDEWSRANAWLVKREEWPYATEEGVRSWAGPSFSETMRTAKTAIDAVRAAQAACTGGRA